MRGDVKLHQRIKRRYKKDGLRSVIKTGMRTLLRRAGLFKPYVKLRYLKHRLNGYYSLVDPFKTIYVDPNEIEKYTLEFNAYEVYGDLKGGDWDKDSKPFENLAKYKAIKARHEEDLRWEETGIYDELLSIIEERGVIDDCHDLSDLRDRYSEVDKLYQNIKNNGYKTSEELSEHKLKGRGDINEICVCIGRDGEFIFLGDGFHRLSIAKVLNINEIPVKVALRHTEWQLKRQKIAGHTGSDTQEKHVDLYDVS